MNKVLKITAIAVPSLLVAVITSVVFFGQSKQYSGDFSLASVAEANAIDKIAESNYQPITEIKIDSATNNNNKSSAKNNQTAAVKTQKEANTSVPNKICEDIRADFSKHDTYEKYYQYWIDIHKDTQAWRSFSANLSEKERFAYSRPDYAFQYAKKLYEDKLASNNCN